MLRRWWVGKYRLPPTSPLYLAYTLEELILEWVEDMLAKDPKFDFGDANAISEDVQFVTGDADLDRVEALHAEGSMDALMAELESWEKGAPKPVDEEEQKTRRLRQAYAQAEAEHRKALQDIGDGFTEGDA